MVLYVTIMPFEISTISNGNSLTQYIHITPFADLRMNRTGAMRECLLNVVMTMPFGFLFPWLKKKSNVISVGFSTLFFSACIEIIQLYYCLQGAFHSRSCDVTDLITNTIGGILGYLLYRFMKNLLKLISKTKQKIYNL
jgi:glycopeptide antibiotics resistance protein